MKRLFIFTATLLLCCSAFSQESKTSNPKTENTIMMDTGGVKLPEFPNGVDSLISFLSTNLRYPKEAEKTGIEAKVIVSFVVNKDGSISNVKVEKSKLKNGLFNNITKKAQKCAPLFEEEACGSSVSCPNGFLLQKTESLLPSCLICLSHLD